MRWREVEVLEYKRSMVHRFARSRASAFDDPLLSCQLRYFEVAPGGHTTLERHEHARGPHRVRGSCLVGDRVYDVAEHDLVHVPSLTWHQFRADKNEPLGFLCMVNAVRDRPQLPTMDDLRRLREDPAVAEFIAR
jgi:mannose-6-phosphate isomerase-like protein (cupin superfamily)